MLVLMRKAGEAVMIGDDVTVIVTKIENNRVCLGIEAPKNVAVHREEIYEAIQRKEQGLPPRARKDQS